MNRIQFWIVTSLSSVLFVFLMGHIALVLMMNSAQNRLAGAQQTINEGQASQSMLKQLAQRIFSDSQKTQDPGLKDLLTRQQISYNPPPADTNATENPAPAPASTLPAPTH